PTIPKQSIGVPSELLIALYASQTGTRERRARVPVTKAVNSLGTNVADRSYEARLKFLLNNQVPALNVSTRQLPFAVWRPDAVNFNVRGTRQGACIRIRKRHNRDASGKRANSNQAIARGPGIRNRKRVESA